LPVIMLSLTSWCALVVDAAARARRETTGDGHVIEDGLNTRQHMEHAVFVLAVDDRVGRAVAGNRQVLRDIKITTEASVFRTAHPLAMPMTIGVPSSAVSKVTTSGTPAGLLGVLFAAMIASRSEIAPSGPGSATRSPIVVVSPSSTSSACPR